MCQLIHAHARARVDTRTIVEKGRDLLALNCIWLSVNKLCVDIYSGHFTLLIDHEQTGDLPQ